MFASRHFKSNFGPAFLNLEFSDWQAIKERFLHNRTEIPAAKFEIFSERFIKILDDIVGLTQFLVKIVKEIFEGIFVISLRTAQVLRAITLRARF